MNILYVANLGTNNSSGVNVVVPQHMKYQAKHANIGFYNLQRISMPIDRNVRVLDRSEYPEFDLSKFPVPFNLPDLVVFHDIFSSLTFCKIAKELQKKNIPYIVVPHGCFTHSAIKRGKIKKVAALHTIYKTLVYKSDAIQYLTEDERKNSYIKHNSIIVPNGTFIPERVELDKDKSKNVSFVFIGRKDIYHKGIDYLLEACSLTADIMRKNGATLTLYGPDRKGSFSEIDKIISEYKINDFVFNKDGVFDQEKEEVLKKSSVFVLTSRLEGQPIALLEACAYSLPVLVTPGTNVSEEIERFNCGWVASLSGESIAERITHIINHQDEIAICSKNAYTYVAEVYGWEKVASDAIEKYKEFVNDNPIG